MRRPATALAAALMLAGCGGGQPAPHVDAAQTLRDGAVAIAALKTVSATLKFTRGTISFQGLALVNAKAAVRLPDDSDTVYTVKQQDFSLPIEVLITAGHVYVRPPFSRYTEASPADAALVPNLAKLFDQSTGLPAVIRAGGNPQFVSTDQVDGAGANQIAATYTPEQVHGMLSALNSSGDVHARIWVDVSDHLIRKAVLDGHFGDGGKPATVEVGLSGFNGAVVIPSPTP